MATKKCKYCKSEMDIDAKICPNCRKGQGLPIIRILLILILLAILFGMVKCTAYLFSDNDTNKKSSSTSPTIQQETPPPPKVVGVGKLQVERVLDWGCTIKGTVSNVSGQNLEGIEVIVNLYDKNGSYIDTAKTTLKEGLPINKSWRFELSLWNNDVYSSDIKEINAW